MKANELRIGNLVQPENIKKALIDDVIVVETLGEDGINYYLTKEFDVPVLEYDGLFYSSINGIPLTEEWLLKFGFVKEDKYFYTMIFNNKKENNGTEGNSFINKIIIDITSKSKESYLVWLSNSVSNLMVCYRLKHVHQLQNLYFALTGEELELGTVGGDS